MLIRLQSLALGGRPIECSSASITWNRHGLMLSWEGFVRGGGTTDLMDEDKMWLEGETSDDRQVTGYVIVTGIHPLTGDFRFQGTGSLSVDGREPLR